MNETSGGALSAPHDVDGWPRIAVFGAGAVGCYFGARLAMAGAPVTLIGRPAHVQAIAAHGLQFESGGRRQAVTIAAQTETDAVAEADLVLFCVKSRDTESGARTIAPLLRPDATVVSLQNGVDNAARMRAAGGIDALAAVVYVACSMPEPGLLRHAGRGDLLIGEVGAPPEEAVRVADRAARVAAVFERAGVPCPVSADVRVDLWVKLVMNCVFNPLSALGRSHYGKMIADADTRRLMRDVVAECVAVAHADGVALSEVDVLHDAALKLGAAMAGATSSTAQDLSLGRPTEIGALNGYVVERGRALGVPVPVNRALVTLVQLLESA